MPPKHEQVTFSPDADVAANTEMDVAAELLPEKIDVRGDNDPVVDATIKSGAEDTSQAGTTVLGTTDLTSVGQGAAGDPAAGEIVVVDGSTIALGDALDNNSYLDLTVETRSGENRAL